MLVEKAVLTGRINQWHWLNPHLCDFNLREMHELNS